MFENKVWLIDPFLIVLLAVGIPAIGTCLFMIWWEGAEDRKYKKHHRAGRTRDL